MKRTLLYIGSVFILILSAITFIFVPAMLDRSSGGAYTLGSYKGKKLELVPGTPLANAIGNFETLYKSQFSQVDSMSAEQQQYYRNALYYRMYGDAFNAAVYFTAADYALKKSGYEPSTFAVSRELLPYFSDENGYSARLYNATSESTRNELKKDVTNLLIWNQYYEDVFGTGEHTSDSYYMGLTCLQNYPTYVQQLQFAGPKTVGGAALYGLKASDAELEFLASLGKTRRSFDLAAWDKTTYPDQEVIMFGVDHYELFNKHELSLISVADKAQADKIATQIKNNELTFDDAVAEYSEKYYSESDGILTQNYEYQIKEIIPDEDAYNAVLALEKDAISDVVQTANNAYAIFRRNEKRSLTQLNVNENIDLVRNYIDTHESGLVEEYYTNLAKNFTANAVANGFDRACRDADVTKIEVPAFALNFGNLSISSEIPSDISELSGASTNEHFLETAFALKNGEISEPIVLNNRILVLKLTGEQSEPVTEENKAAIATDIVTYDIARFQSELLSSPDVKNTVYEFVSNNVVNN